ncbi:WAS/WASL-interacting protein family member 1-like, partial [Pteropus vampyrus]|uniref:WAS/WASL-interacting protein family member 1-like n=1 Tax=Pteropus vampyrus TaxID=132908 RepID=A0A6P3S5I3_PTEVA
MVSGSPRGPRPGAGIRAWRAARGAGGGQRPEGLGRASNVRGRGAPPLASVPCSDAYGQGRRPQKKATPTPDWHNRSRETRRGPVRGIPEGSRQRALGVRSGQGPAIVQDTKPESVTLGDSSTPPPPQAHSAKASCASPRLAGDLRARAPLRAPNLVRSRRRLLRPAPGLHRARARNLGGPLAPSAPAARPAPPAPRSRPVLQSPDRPGPPGDSAHCRLPPPAPHALRHPRSTLRRPGPAPPNPQSEILPDASLT